MRKKDSSKDQIGEVVWHSLNESGKTEYYDVQWKDGVIEKNIHIRYLIPEQTQQHEHEAKEKNINKESTDIWIKKSDLVSLVGKLIYKK